MLHIDPATLRRHPWIGVLLGFSTAAVIGFLLMTGMTEARELLRQGTPRSLGVHEMLVAHGAQWVTLSHGQWHCDRAITIERGPGIERWVLGPIETTEVPITDTRPGEMLVARFDGAVSCENRAAARLTGVIGSTQIFTSRATLRRWSRDGDRVVVMSVGESPRSALFLLVGIVAVGLLGAGFGTYYLRLMIPRPERREASPQAYVPLEPR